MNEELLKLYPEGVQLRGDVLLTESKNLMSFIYKKKIIVKVTDINEKTFIKRLRQGIDFEELSKQNHYPWHQKLLSLLHKHNCLKPYISLEKRNSVLGRQLEWLSHFSADPSRIQKNLETANVCIVGCGGTGCLITEHLVRAGIQKFILIDDGVIDLPDMNRQLTYYPKDCGRLKVEVLTERLLSINAAVKIVQIVQFIESREQFLKILRNEKPNLVINCADKPMGLINAFITEACLEEEVVVLFGSVGLLQGTLGPLLISPEAKSNYAHMMQDAYHRLKDNENIPFASLSFTNSLMAVYIAFEAFKFLTGTIESLVVDHSKTINLLNLNTVIS